MNDIIILGIMNIEYLRNFIQLCDYKSFSDLARDLSISQSTLSHRISQLEKELDDVVLIERSTKTFKLTSEGEILLKYALKIVEAYDECKQEINRLKQQIVEEIVISTSKLPGSHILPKFIAKFKTEHRGADFSILINNSKSSIKLLKKGMADFSGIGSFMDYSRDDFDYIKIGEDKMFFICSPQNNLIKNGNETVSFEDLKKKPFIFREKGSGTREVFSKSFPKFNELDLKLEMNDNDSIISAVSDSEYISVLSEQIARKAADAGLVRILEVKEYPNLGTRNIYFLKLREKHLKGLKKKFWEYLK
ncbi:MAG: HTH-type transcriptional regulator CysL [Promethearchaeota archaeon]|nr:MAG: HTH-type transcriptional regulator CysL [Candidatus Lokiarchaeota archaeon]